MLPRLVGQTLQRTCTHKFAYLTLKLNLCGRFQAW